MVDTKISALAAATAVAAANELAINEAGTSKKVTAAQLRTFTGPKYIAGATGAGNDTAAPSETWQYLNAAPTANSTTTLVTVMSTTGLPAGKYLFEYFIVWQSATATVGVKFAVDFTGTVGRFRATRHFQGTGAAAATGVSDSTSAVLTGALVEHHTTIVNAGALGPNTGVDTINVDQFDHIRGILVCSTAGDLNLQHASETASSTTVRADTMLVLKRFE